jgi:hypothetical protein
MVDDCMAVADPPGCSKTPADRQSLLAFVADENSRAALARAVQDLQLNDAQVSIGTVADAVGVLTGMATPQRLVID